MQGRGIRYGIKEGSEVAPRRDLGILLTKTAGGGVARIGERIAAFRIGLFVQAHEAALGHVDLTAHLDGHACIGSHVGKSGGGKAHGHVTDSAHVERDVLACGAIAARGGAHKGAVLIGDRHAEAVDLELAGIGNLSRTERRLRALEPFIQLLEVHSVIHGVHARHVRHRLELLDIHEAATHALRVGLRRDELGIARLDVLQLDEELVEGGVRDLGCIEDVIAVSMVLKQVVELGGAFRSDSTLIIEHRRRNPHLPAHGCPVRRVPLVRRRDGVHIVKKAQLLHSDPHSLAFRHTL